MSQQKTFAIGIPTLNRADLLVEQLNHYRKTFANTYIYVYDNDHQRILHNYDKPGNVILLGGSGTNVGVAKSWNILCDTIFASFPNALILNDDIILGCSENDISSFITKNQSQRLYISPSGWDAFLMPQFVYKRVGPFDTDFYPAYCEDWDYEYRMQLLAMAPLKDNVLMPAIHRTSSTINKDPDKFWMIGAQSRKKYITKWGGVRHEEQFKIPYQKM